MFLEDLERIVTMLREDGESYWSRLPLRERLLLSALPSRAPYRRPFDVVKQSRNRIIVADLADLVTLPKDALNNLTLETTRVRVELHKEIAQVIVQNKDDAVAMATAENNKSYVQTQTDRSLKVWYSVLGPVAWFLPLLAALSIFMAVASFFTTTGKPVVEVPLWLSGFAAMAGVAAFMNHSVSGVLIAPFKRSEFRANDTARRRWRVSTTVAVTAILTAATTNLINR
ncbi:hypothetical protein [Vallicoccus soli]|uniref:Uncharacterized protein n=1 Tax=Vallicoccus soli TaxID=2339232 RepID=A0A3A3Z2R8_9ACTN|nr:hypothetical protein [Vallicoccus soli]RJK94741.1 hypothetical protein D5H78_12950 [Vallicoccus soli]